MHIPYDACKRLGHYYDMKVKKISPRSDRLVQFGRSTRYFGGLCLQCIWRKESDQAAEQLSEYCNE